MTDPKPILFTFHWRNAAGKRTELNCWAASEAEAEDSARRAGWPGHDGTRLGRYRAWLKRALLTDEKFSNEDA